MLVRHYHRNKVYIIEFPPGSRVSRSVAAGESAIYIKTEDGEILIFERPGVLMVQLAEAGRHGLRLVRVERIPKM